VNQNVEAILNMGMRNALQHVLEA